MTIRAVDGARVHWALAPLGFRVDKEHGRIVGRYEDMVVDVACAEGVLRVAALWDRRLTGEDQIAAAMFVANQIQRDSLGPKISVSRRLGTIIVEYAVVVSQGLSDEQLRTGLALMIADITRQRSVLEDNFGPFVEQRERP